MDFFHAKKVFLSAIFNGKNLVEVSDVRHSDLAFLNIFF